MAYLNNEELLRKIETKKTFILSIRKRDLRFIGLNEEEQLGEFDTRKT